MEAACPPNPAPDIPFDRSLPVQLLHAFLMLQAFPRHSWKSAAIVSKSPFTPISERGVSWALILVTGLVALRSQQISCGAGDDITLYAVILGYIILSHVVLYSLSHSLPSSGAGLARHLRGSRPVSRRHAPGATPPLEGQAPAARGRQCCGRPVAPGPPPCSWFGGSLFGVGQALFPIER